MFLGLKTLLKGNVKQAFNLLLFLKVMISKLLKLFHKSPLVLYFYFLLFKFDNKKLRIKV